MVYCLLFMVRGRPFYVWSFNLFDSCPKDEDLGFLVL